MGLVKPERKKILSALFSEPSVSQIARNLDGKSIGVTGATGALGKVTMEIIDAISSNFGVRISVKSYSRTQQLTPRTYQTLIVRHYVGHRREFIESLVQGPPELFINLAFPTSKSTGYGDPFQMQDAVWLAEDLIEGLHQSTSAPVRFVNVSSGAVYGPHSETAPISLTDRFTPKQWPDSNRELYSNAKRYVENLVNRATEEGIIFGANVRVFSLMGPGLPLGEGYAIGNFLLQAVSGSSIQISGSRYSLRSYVPLEIAALNLIQVATSDLEGPFHIAGEHPRTLLEWARMVSQTLSNCQIETLSKSAVPGHYVGEPDARLLVHNPISHQEYFMEWARFVEGQ